MELNTLIIVKNILAYAQTHPEKITLTIRNNIGQTGYQIALADNVKDVLALFWQKQPDLANYHKNDVYTKWIIQGMNS